MNKKELFKHLDLHTKRNGIVWVEDHIDNKKVYTAYGREKDILIFNNQWMLSFNPNTKDFLKTNFETKSSAQCISTLKDLKCEEGRKLIDTMNLTLNRKIKID
ncbi:MAG: hypothetical protein ACRCW9_09855 [Cetobacterium sp.]